MGKRTIGCQLRQLNTALILYGKESMEGLGVTPAQGMLLDYLLLKKQEEYYMTDICTELNLAKATVSVMVKGLRNYGYLNITADPEDERKRKIVLSKKAFQVQEELEKRLEDSGERMFRGITEEEWKNLEKTLDKMIINLKPTTEKEAKLW